MCHALLCQLRMSVCLSVCVGMQTSSLLDAWSSQRRRRLRLRERLLLRSGTRQVIRSQAHRRRAHPSYHLALQNDLTIHKRVSQLLSRDGKLRILNTASARPRRSCTWQLIAAIKHHFLETAFEQHPASRPFFLCRGDPCLDPRPRI